MKRLGPSDPPKAQFVVKIPRGEFIRIIGAPTIALNTQTAPKSLWQTTRLSASSIASPSGPLVPPDSWMNTPTLRRLPSGMIGHFQTAMVRSAKTLVCGTCDSYELSGRRIATHRCETEARLLLLLIILPHHGRSHRGDVSSLLGMRSTKGSGGRCVGNAATATLGNWLSLTRRQADFRVYGSGKLNFGSPHPRSSDLSSNPVRARLARLRPR